MIISFSVQGNAVPKQSFKFRSGKGRSYQPARVKVWEEAVGWAARQAYSGEPLEGELSVTAIFHLAHKRVVDCDNLFKAVGDSLHGVIFVNDSQIVHLEIIKIQPSADACVFVNIKEVRGARK